MATTQSDPNPHLTPRPPKRTFRITALPYWEFVLFAVLAVVTVAGVVVVHRLTQPVPTQAQAPVLRPHFVVASYSAATTHPPPTPTATLLLDEVTHPFVAFATTPVPDDAIQAKQALPVRVPPATATPFVAASLSPWAQLAEDSALYSAPQLNAPQHGRVVAGELVQLDAWVGDWWLVHGANGDGWLNKTVVVADVEAVGHVPFAAAAAPAAAAGVLLNGGNLRAQPALDAPVVAGVDHGDVLMVVGQTPGWWQVRTAAFAGWLHMSLVTLDARSTQIAAKFAPPAPRANPQGEIRIASANLPTIKPTVVPKPQPPRVVPTRRALPTQTPRPAPTRAAPPAQPPRATPTRSAPAAPSWPVAAGPGNLVHLVGVSAPHPYLAPGAVGAFNRARSRVLRASGVDYLKSLGEAFRSIGFTSNKPGVAERSWHKAGRAIDVAQWFTVGGRQGVVFIPDQSAPGLWRVLLRTARQDGSLGAWYGPKALGRRAVAAYYVDVTTILLSEGWTRVRSYEGVSEAWHYELKAGLSWRQAMLQLYPKRTVNAYYP